MQTVSRRFLPTFWLTFVGYLTLEKDGVTAEDVELFHLLFGHFDDGVVIVLAVLNSELVGGLLLIENSLGIVFFTKNRTG